MFEMWNNVSSKLEQAQSNIQQTQQPHTSGGSIKGTHCYILSFICGALMTSCISTARDSARSTLFWNAFVCVFYCRCSKVVGLSFAGGKSCKKCFYFGLFVKINIFYEIWISINIDIQIFWYLLLFFWTIIIWLKKFISWKKPK